MNLFDNPSIAGLQRQHLLLISNLRSCSPSQQVSKYRLWASERCTNTLVSSPNVANFEFDNENYKNKKFKRNFRSWSEASELLQAKRKFAVRLQFSLWIFRHFQADTDLEGRVRIHKSANDNNYNLSRMESSYRSLTVQCIISIFLIILLQKLCKPINVVKGFLSQINFFTNHYYYLCRTYICTKSTRESKLKISIIRNIHGSTWKDVTDLFCKRFSSIWEKWWRNVSIILRDLIQAKLEIKYFFDESTLVNYLFHQTMILSNILFCEFYSSVGLILMKDVADLVLCTYTSTLKENDAQKSR